MILEWVFLAFSAVAETITAYHLFRHFLEPKDDNRVQIIFKSAIFVLSLLLISFFQNMALNIASAVFIFIVYAKVLFRADYRRAIGWTIIFILVAIAAETGTGLAIASVFAIDIDIATTIAFYNAMIHFISKTLAFILVRLIIVFIPARNTKQFDRYSLLLLTFPTCAIINEFLLMNIMVHAVVPRATVLFAAFTSLGLFVSSFIIVLVHDYNIQKQELEQALKMTKQKAIASEKYYQMQAKNLQEKRALLHDIKNHVQNLHAAYDKNLPQSTDYYNSVICAIEKNASVLEIEIGNPLLSMILQEAQIACSKKGIKFICVPQYFEMDFLTPIDTSTIFDNAIENAITACLQDTIACEKWIKVSIYKAAYYIVFEFANTCMPRLLCFENGKLISTKTQGDLAEHGLGIKNIITAAQRYGGHASYTCENNEFHLFVRVQEKIHN